MDAIQKKVKQIIESESEFLYNFLLNMPEKQRNIGILGLLPFLSVYVEGVAKWSAVALKRDNPFNKQEKLVYSAIRQGIKLFENDFDTNVSIIKGEMSIHEEAFQPDFFGDITCKEHIIGNTYLTGVYLNITKLRDIYSNSMDVKTLKYGEEELGLLLRDVSIVGGRIIRLNLSRTRDLNFNIIDLEQSDLFTFNNPKYRMSKPSDICWLNLLCQINYIIYFLNRLTENQDFFVFRCAYIVYYYTLLFISNVESEISIENEWEHREFRNALAHYGIKRALGKNKLLSADAFGGLTHYFFNKSYEEMYNVIIDELINVSNQLEGKCLLSS